MTIINISAWFMLVFTGLFAGAIVFIAVERTNLWERMPVEQYAADFRRSIGRSALLPILGAIGTAGAIVFALNTRGREAGLAWTGAGLSVAVFVATAFIAGPINAKFMRGDEGEVPADADQLRDRWRRFHWARTVVVLGALACLAAAAAVM